MPDLYLPINTKKLGDGGFIEAGTSPMEDCEAVWRLSWTLQGSKPSLSASPSSLSSCSPGVTAGSS
jgi:hypothetical protein